MRVTVWNEFRHERANPAVAAIYPDGIHATIARALRAAGIGDVRTATLDEPAQGLPPEVLARTDARAICDRVHGGMGLVVLHSGHFSKPFRRLMGTPCTVRWRADGELERIWVVAPSHPVAAGVPAYFELALEEMYCEPFEVPEPDELVFISWFKGGEVFRSGCAYRRGRGRVFYFRPGHETFPTYHDTTVQRVIANATRWVAPAAVTAEPFVNLRVEPVEPL